MRVTALASGSSGNAFLVETGATRVLLDAGLTAPLLESYLWARRVSPSSLAAIFLSHEHTDHLRGAGALARRHRLPLIANGGTFAAGSAALGRVAERMELPTGGECRAGGLLVRTFAVSHDARETVGFWVEAEARHVCICTDLGVDTATIYEPLQAADLLVLEANHALARL